MGKRHGLQGPYRIRNAEFVAKNFVVEIEEIIGRVFIENYFTVDLRSQCVAQLVSSQLTMVPKLVLVVSTEKKPSKPQDDLE